MKWGSKVKHKDDQPQELFLSSLLSQEVFNFLKFTF